MAPELRGLGPTPTVFGWRWDIYIYIIFFRLAVSFALRKEEDKKDKAIGPVGKVVNEVISYRSLAE